MKVRLLGTGAIYSKYNCASELIDDKILVDAGNGVLKELRKVNYDLSELKIIIITHLHADHYADLPALILNLEVEENLKPIYIAGPKGLKETYISMIKGTNYHMGINDIEAIRKTYKNKIIATHLRDDTREELKKKCLKDVIIKEDGVEMIV